jgi:hypothetical protein
VTLTAGKCVVAVPESGPWQDINNLKVQDGTYTTISHRYNGWMWPNPKGLILYNFGFEIPEAATVLGLSVRIRGHASHKGAFDFAYVGIGDPCLNYLIDSQMGYWALGATKLELTDTDFVSEVIALPGREDSLTPAIINASEFSLGSGLAAQGDGSYPWAYRGGVMSGNSATTVIQYIDAVELTVEYSVGFGKVIGKAHTEVAFIDGVDSELIKQVV